MYEHLTTLYENLATLLEAEPELDAQRILRIVRPSVRLMVGSKNPSSYPLGASRLGGIPDVPPQFVWPYWQPRPDETDCCGAPLRSLEPIPLNFIAQLDLSAIPQIDEAMPTSGWLYFFYDLLGQPWGTDPHEADRFRVIYVNCSRSTLSPAEKPEEIDPEFDTGDNWDLVPSVELTLPDEYIGFEEYESPRYFAYQRLAAQLTYQGKHPSRFLGHADLVQSPLENLGNPFETEEDASLDISEEEVDELLAQIRRGELQFEDSHHERIHALENDLYPWRLLLQIDGVASDETVFWNDEGRLFFMIRKDDLLAKRFDRVWLNLQTT